MPCEVKHDLKWSDEKIYLLTETLNSVEEMQAIWARNANLNNNYAAFDSETCNCIYSLGCGGPMAPNGTCVTANCGINYNTDCGILGNYAYTGRCQ